MKTEGTTQYPNELVCRVNGVPAADFDITHKGGTYREECSEHARRLRLLVALGQAGRR